jgi:hypothetical protein
MHLQCTTTTTTPFKIGEAGRHERAPLMFQLRATVAHGHRRGHGRRQHPIYTTTATMIMHGEREAKTEN